MKFWVTHCWKPFCRNSMHLVLDVHRAQKTKAIQKMLEEDCQTSITYIPGGCTSLVQPLDVSFNKPFKSAVERLATQHLQDNLDTYVKGQINASERHILFTKWVGQTWEEVSANRDMVIRSFKKCGIAVPIDGSEDHEINIKGLDDYVVEDEVYTDEDPFADDDCEVDPIY